MCQVLIWPKLFPSFVSCPGADRIICFKEKPASLVMLLAKIPVFSCFNWKLPRRTYICIYLYPVSKTLWCQKNFVIAGEGSCDWDEQLPIKQQNLSGEPGNKGMLKELVAMTALPHQDAAQISEFPN